MKVCENCKHWVEDYDGIGIWGGKMKCSKGDENANIRYTCDKWSYNY